MPAAVAAQDPFPFEGTWDCGNGLIALDTETYFNGADTLTITEVTEDDLGFVLRFADGQDIALSGITADRMDWQSGGSGVTTTCVRVE